MARSAPTEARLPRTEARSEETEARRGQTIPDPLPGRYLATGKARPPASIGADQGPRYAATLEPRSATTVPRSDGNGAIPAVGANPGYVCRETSLGPWQPWVGLPGVSLRSGEVVGRSPATHRGGHASRSRGGSSLPTGRASTPSRRIDDRCRPTLTERDRLGADIAGDRATVDPREPRGRAPSPPGFARARAPALESPVSVPKSSRRGPQVCPTVPASPPAPTPRVPRSPRPVRTPPQEQERAPRPEAEREERGSPRRSPRRSPKRGPPPWSPP